MRLEKLSSTLALVAYEFEKINNEKLIKPFPTNRPQAFSIPGVRDLTAEINASTEVLIFVHLNPDVSVDKSINLPANVEPIHFHSRTGSIRVARVPLASLGALSDLTSVRHLSASMRLRAASDFSDIETKLNNFIDEREDLKQSGVVIGLINSEISSALTTFSGNIQSVWDQTEAGTGWDIPAHQCAFPRINTFMADFGDLALVDVSNAPDGFPGGLVFGPALIRREPDFRGNYIHYVRAALCNTTEDPTNVPEGTTLRVTIFDDGNDTDF